MTTDDADSRDERIGRVLNEYLDRKQRGEPADEMALLEAHPDLAEELQAHFGMVRQVRSASSRGEPGDADAPVLPQDALPGYEIQGEIHRGGQGVVYRALQKATRRSVAIKVMREGPFAGWRDRARFEREVQVLGALNHPGIVTIHDTGTAAGCHFFVMDYVAGLPLDLWLGGTSRRVEEILRLFLTICDAVNAAHVKGIIHRDLKPGNIRIDEESKPHVLDFGLAKVAAHDDQASPAGGMTVVGQFVGSLPWTSPEQAQGTLDHVDTRTDVYALGVILYQMLTGAFPYEVAGPMRDVLNRIVTDEPVRPSTLRKEIDHDAEAIVLKCLRKEPHQRYQTAGELSRDVERYLSGEPIAARSDSGLYVMGKMLRRHRVPVAVATAFAVLIGASLLGSVSLWRRAVAERDRAIAARRQEDQERRRADAKAVEAEHARDIAERERARAEEQAEQLRRQTYLKGMALARNAYDQKSLTQARQYLETCPDDLRGWEWHYLSRLSSQSALLEVPADSECVAAMALSPDGGTIATAGCDGVIRIWDAATGDAVIQLPGHTDRVNALAYSPAGTWIASGSRDRTLRLWDARTGAHRVLEEGEQYVNAVAFSPDGSRLVAGGQSRVLIFWDVALGRAILTTPVLDREISCVAYSPDGTRVVSGELLNPPAASSRVRIWDAAAGQSMRELGGHPGAVLCVAFSPDGARIAAGGGIALIGRDALGTLKVFDSATGEGLLSLPGHEGFVDAVAFSPDGTRLASAGVPHSPAAGMESDRTLKVWDAGSGEELCIYSAHDRGGRAVAWSPDASRIYSGGMDGRWKAWPRTTSPEARVLRGHSGSVLRVAFSPDGQRLASAGGQGESGRPEDGAKDTTVRVWDVESGAESLALTGHADAVLALAWSPDGRRIASGSADRTIRLWDGTRGAADRVLANQAGVVRSVAFSPDSRLLAGVAGQRAVFWNVADGQEHRQLWHSDTLLTIAFSPDGRRIATAAVGGEIRVWDSGSDSAYHSISTGRGLNGAWFSPDSKTIASAHFNGSIVLWGASTGERLAVMSGPQRSVEWLDFSPDGRRIVSCASDLALRLRDVASGSEVYSVRAHEAPVTCVKFSPGGSRIATCGQDGLIKLWEAGIRAR